MSSRTVWPFGFTLLNIFDRRPTYFELNVSAIRRSEKLCSQSMQSRANTVSGESIALLTCSIISERAQTDIEGKSIPNCSRVIFSVADSGSVKLILYLDWVVFLVNGIFCVTEREIPDLLFFPFFFCLRDSYGADTF